MESFWAHGKGEHVLVSGGGDVGGAGVGDWKADGVLQQRTSHSRLEYRSPVEYLTSVGFIPKTLAEIGLESGSVSGTQARHRPFKISPLN